MTGYLFTTLPVAFTNPTGLPRVLNFPQIFEGWINTDGLLGWFDFSNAANVTQVSSKVSSIAPRLGSIASLAQSDAAKRPTYASERAVFSAASSTFLTAASGWPANSVTVATIMRRAASATGVEVVASSYTASNQLAQIYYQANGELRTRITSAATSTYQEPDSPIPPNAENFLVIGDYSPTTDQARCRLNAGGAGTTFAASADITMASAWTLGANTTTGGSHLNGEVADVFMFDSAKIGTDVAAVLLEYAQQFKGVAT